MRHLTAVYTVHDDAAFEEEEQRIAAISMATLDEQGRPISDRPWAITAMSVDHELLDIARGGGMGDREALDAIRSLIETDDLEGEIIEQRHRQHVRDLPFALIAAGGEP